MHTIIWLTASVVKQTLYCLRLVFPEGVLMRHTHTISVNVIPEDGLALGILT